MACKTIREELAEKFPAAIERAKTGRSAAIKLFCIACFGGSRAEAKRCASTDCFLWPFSLAASQKKESDPTKVSAAKARWDALTEEEKAERIAKLKAKKPNADVEDVIDEEDADDSELT